MGTRTPNYDLYIPGQGEEAWDDEVGGNFTTIDAALQALAAIIDGAVYQINNVTYVASNARWNGSAWNRVDTGAPAVRLTLNSTNGSLEIATAAAGANPITWTTIQVFSATGLDMKSKKVYNLATPTAATDAATKAYIDGLIAALKLSQIAIDADKNWNGKSITNVGAITGAVFVPLLTEVTFRHLPDESRNAANQVYQDLTEFSTESTSYVLAKTFPAIPSSGFIAADGSGITVQCDIFAWDGDSQPCYVDFRVGGESRAELKSDYTLFYHTKWINVPVNPGEVIKVWFKSGTPNGPSKLKNVKVFSLKELYRVRPPTVPW